MRYYLISCLLAVHLGLYAQVVSTVPSAAEILEPAYVRAATGGKNVLLIFHASWCGWCRKLDASLQDTAVKPMIDKQYEVVHLTVYESAAKKHLENKGALKFLTDKGGAGIGLPYWYVLDMDGNVLADSQYAPGKNTGCPATIEEVDYFISVLKKTSTIHPDSLTVIYNRFRKNE